LVTTTDGEGRNWKKISAVAGLLFAAFMTYRIFGVYTVRTGRCRLERPPVPPQERDSVRDAGGRVRHFPRRGPAAAAAPSLLVMTYNIEGHAVLWRPTHLEQIAAVIRKYSPDIVGLQEVHRHTWQSRFRDQAAELARLTGMHIIFGKSFGKKEQFGNAVLTRGRILSSRIHELPSIGEPRTVLETDVEIGSNDLTFFVTHLTTWGRIRRGTRGEQIHCFTELTRRSQLPFLLVGDFNTTPEAPEIRELLASNQMKACGVMSDPTYRFTRQHIDYVFADYGWDVRSVRILHEGPSDHYPVLAELRWLPQSEGSRP
jgi:endonuclease/exonuclease/phosphatase family metal-dependent hydrolase